MVNLDQVRKDPEVFKEAIRLRMDGVPKRIDKFLNNDKKRRHLISKVQKLREKQNEISSSGGKPTKKQIEKAKELKKSINKLEKSLTKVENDWQILYDSIPNLPREDTPEGKEEEDNVDIYAYIPNKGEIDKSKLGKPNSAKKYMPKKPIHTVEDFEPRHHLDIGENLGIIDTEQSAKVSGSRFSYLKGDLVLLQYAIFNMLKDKLLEEDFTPMIPPLLVKDTALYGTSHFPKGKDQIYKLDTFNVEEENQLYLVGSSEPTNFSYYMGKTLEQEKLPVKMFAYTTCFRSEVGSWGKDVRGIKRVHQFDKMEMNIICTPENSDYLAEEYLLGINKWFWKTLDIPFRIVRKCYGDMGYDASHAQWDPEAWLPSQQEFMELGTSTNTTDYQARRLNIHYKDNENNRQLVHTVNDTGMTTRTLIAIIDNYQQADGSVKVPKVLQPYLNKEYIR